MARKVAKQPVAGALSKSASAAAKELEVLHPDREVVIAGRGVMVREYGFIEGAKLAPLIKPLTDALHGLIADADAPPGFDAIAFVMAEHIDAVVQLVATAADVEPEWITGLSDQDGDFLMQVWWQTNAHFFIRRVLRKAAQEKVARRLAGGVSTPPSSAPATHEPPQS